MLKRTREIKEILQGLGSIEEKLKALEGAYAGETCYLLTCGPSLNVFWNDRLRKKLEDKLVVSVKQTFDLAPEIFDFQLLNSWNYKRYDYRQNEPIIIWEKAPNDPLTAGMKCDLMFPVVDAGKLDRRLAVMKNFDDYIFTRTIGRQWGPGIIYELGIYLMVHLGVSEMIAVGWDLGEKNSKVMEHFFDDDKAKSNDIAVISNSLSIKARKSRLLRLYFDLLDRVIFRNKKVIYNKPRIIPEEVEVIADSTRDLYRWLKGRGIDLKIVSDRSLVDPCVPRVEI